MASVADFEQILFQILSPDNDVRKHAETLFEQAKQYPDQMITFLIQLLRASQYAEVRALCAVMVRRLLATSAAQSMWMAITAGVQTLVKDELLLSLENESAANVRHKVCDTIGEMAALLVEPGQWQELLPALLRYAKSPQWPHRESAFLIFAQVSHSLSSILKPHFQTMFTLFQEGLVDAESIKVRCAALSATTSFLTALENDQREIFRGLIPTMLETIRAALVANEESSTRAALEVLIGLAETEPTFLRQHLVLVVSTMTTIAQTNDLDDSIRQLAMEFLMTLAESASSMVRKMGTFVQQVFPIGLSFMLERDEDTSDWNDEEDDSDEESNSSVGEQSLDRLAMALGGKAVLPVAFSLIPNFLPNPDWRYRHAAMMAISVIGEGCQKTMQTQLGSILQMVLNHFADPHPRVRYAACNAIGQMSTDFGPHLQESFHAIVLPALLSLMDDAANPRVQSHAAAAVINFTEHCKKETLHPYLDTLLSKLLVLLQGSRKVVQEQAITAVASVADCANEFFVKYYDTFMPMLKQILFHAQSREYRMLRGKSMECISLIGMAVGKEKFQADARDVMDFLVQAQQLQYESDDPQVGYMLQAWARICTCLGDAFIPYLAVVMPPLIRSASIKPDVTIADADDEENAREQGWETLVLGDKMVAVRTSALEEKATACNLLCCYISELGAGFYPHIEQAAQLLVPLIKFYISDEVRDAAISSLSDMLNCVKLAHEQAGRADSGQLKQLLDYILSYLLPAIPDEPEMEVLINMMEALSQCLKAGGPNCLTYDQMGVVTQCLTTVVQESEKRRAKRHERHHNEDFDEEEGEELADADGREEDLIGQVGETINQLVKQHGEQFLPIFDVFAQQLSVYLQPNRTTNDFVTILCIFDDVIEFGGAQASRYIPAMLPVFFGCLNHSATTVKQAAVYGVGLCARFGGAAFHPFIAQAVPALVNLITAADARANENILVTENAVSALGQMCLQQAHFDVAQPWLLWLQNLPIVKDDEEAPKVANVLCDQVQANNPYVLGAGNGNVPVIIRVFAQWLSAVNPDDDKKSLLDNTLKGRIVELIKWMRSALPADLLQVAWQGLAPELQQVLSHYGVA
eukprot:TRINITY_DN2935_c0_g1_i1.p1 TRINITY_DN2935_c0_g1~~TRINITY_DN2935_c0_g1_i1.p1  ORF type:complete len:1109 (-),score=299.02 TRINITY_DN2935_c0_g1_i1:650-3934(-)